MTIAIPIGVIFCVVAWYLVRHKEVWQWRQIILGALIGLLGLGSFGPGIGEALNSGAGQLSVIVSRMFNAAVGG